MELGYARQIRLWRLYEDRHRDETVPRACLRFELRQPVHRALRHERDRIRRDIADIRCECLDPEREHWIGATVDLNRDRYTITRKCSVGKRAALRAGALV